MRAKKKTLRKGAAVVELAVLLPFLMFLCVIATDWARLFYYTISTEACARNGALYACDEVTRAQSPYTNVQEAAMSEAPSLDSIATVISTNTTDSTGSSAVRVTVTVPFKTITNFPGVPSSQTLVRTSLMRMVPTTTR